MIHLHASHCSGQAWMESNISDSFKSLVPAINLILWKTGTLEKGIRRFDACECSTFPDIPGLFTWTRKSARASRKLTAPYFWARISNPTFLIEGCQVILMRRVWMHGGPIGFWICALGVCWRSCCLHLINLAYCWTFLQCSNYNIIWGYLSL